MEKIRIVLLNEAAKPQCMKDGDAGIDLRMNIETAQGYTPLLRGESIMFGTGVKVAIPKGWVGLIMPRSGLGFKYEIRLANTTGVIDSNYRGEIMVKMRNCGEEDVMLEDFERVCQMVVVPHYLVHENLEFVDELDETNRGESGFGDSGRQ
ncbi:dUTPase [Vibrio phage River4]|uniref:dUTP diphosphatase n=1 Tax=Vibrio phage River4 TaxID=2736288 RepID=A0A6M9Z0I6_9CAUD|nr:dUTPase [Vibrio phage River4]QKN84703.1 putative deoxyUTP pyrophosphatase [Vibrio phage River4]